MVATRRRRRLGGGGIKDWFKKTFRHRSSSSPYSFSSDESRRISNFNDRHHFVVRDSKSPPKVDFETTDGSEPTLHLKQGGTYRTHIGGTAMEVEVLRIHVGKHPETKTWAFFNMEVDLREDNNDGNKKHENIIFFNVDEDILQMAHRQYNIRKRTIVNNDEFWSNLREETLTNRDLANCPTACAARIRELEKSLTKKCGDVAEDNKKLEKELIFYRNNYTKLHKHANDGIHIRLDKLKAIDEPNYKDMLNFSVKIETATDVMVDRWIRYIHDLDKKNLSSEDKKFLFLFYQNLDLVPRGVKLAHRLQRIIKEKIGGDSGLQTYLSWIHDMVRTKTHMKDPGASVSKTSSSTTTSWATATSSASSSASSTDSDAGFVHNLLQKLKDWGKHRLPYGED
jgi:hypothetical protein